MRLLLAAVVVMAIGMVGACGLDDAHKKDDKEFSAARLDGKFGSNDPIVQMLSPQEREALDRAGLMAAEDPPELDENGNPIAPTDEDSRSKMDKAGDVMMSLLTVGVTLGMMAAPYLLF